MRLRAYRLHGVVLPGMKPQNIDFIPGTYIDMCINRVIPLIGQ